MTEQIARRRLTPKGEATRNRILDAAISLIAAHGVAGTSTEQVRQAAGVSGSQLYHYFTTKQALIGAVILRQADAGPGAPSLGALDSLEALEAWADAAVERQAEAGGRCDLNTLAAELSTGDAASRGEIRQGYERWRGVLLDGLRAMRDTGVLRPDADLDELALALLTALQGGSLLARTLGTAEPMRAAMHSALAFVRSYAAVPRG